MSHFDDLTAACEQTLIDGLPPNLKAAIDADLAKGFSRQDVLTHCRNRFGNDGRNLTMLAIEAYLGADQYGRITERKAGGQ